MPWAKAETFQELCQKLGLLDGNQEWENVLEEAANSASSPQLRELFIIILMFCEPSNPRGLFDKFWEGWTDDIERKASRKEINLDSDQKKTLLLLDLQLKLQSFEKETFLYQRTQHARGSQGT